MSFRTIAPFDLPRKTEGPFIRFRTDKAKRTQVSLSAALRDKLKPTPRKTGGWESPVLRVHLLVDKETGYFAVSRASDIDESGFLVSGLSGSATAYFSGFKLGEIAGIPDGKYSLTYGEDSERKDGFWTAKIEEQS